MSHSSSQTFLRELDKKLWTAIKESGRLAHPYQITSTGKLIDDALEAVEKENPKLKNVPVASVCDRRTLNHRIARRTPHDFEPNRRSPRPRKTSNGRRPTLQLQIDLANLVGLIDLIDLIDLIATFPFHCSGAVSASYETATVADRRFTAENIIGHDQEPTVSDSSSAFLGDLCAFAVKNSSSFMDIRRIDFGNSFEDLAVGDISSGLTVQQAGDVVDCVGGGTPSTNEAKFWDDGVHHWTTPKDFSSLQSLILIDTSRKLTNAGIAKISFGLLPAGTLLLSSRAAVGYLAISTIEVSVDVSWAKIDLSAFQNNVAISKKIAGKHFEFMLYQGPFGETPDCQTPYIYAAQNRVVIFEAFGKRHLEREPSYEVEMEFAGRTTKQGLYIFSIPAHKGHCYYRGASGAPIIDPTGQIFAILVGGCEFSDELYGYSLGNIHTLIRISEESLKD